MFVFRFDDRRGDTGPAASRRDTRDIVRGRDSVSAQSTASRDGRDRDDRRMEDRNRADTR